MAETFRLVSKNRYLKKLRFGFMKMKSRQTYCNATANTTKL